MVPKGCLCHIPWDGRLASDSLRTKWQCVHRGAWQKRRLATPRPIFDLRFLFWLEGKVVLVSLGSSFGMDVLF